MNVGEDTTLGDGDVAQKLVQLLVVPDGELKVTGDDTGLLVVTGSVTGQLEDFGSEVLEDGSEVDGSTGTDTLSVVALAEKTVDTTNGESETRLGGTAAQCQKVVKKLNEAWRRKWEQPMQIGMQVEDAAWDATGKTARKRRVKQMQDASKASKQKVGDAKTQSQNS